MRYLLKKKLFNYCKTLLSNIFIIFIFFNFTIFAQTSSINKKNIPPKISLNENWKFFKYKPNSKIDDLIYDVRPEFKEYKDYKVADAKPTKAENVTVKKLVLKPWILPTGNDFIKNPSKRYICPEGNPGGDFQFVQNNFDDSKWEEVNLPHDWAIKGPFYEGANPEVGSGMGRLPIQGVAWYRKKLNITKSDKGKSIYLDIDGAMSYAMVWLNGKLVGGWPYGYTSWRLDLTPYINFGSHNQLAIRLDNPNNSSRWYPGGGIYRNVWLVKTNPVHIGHWGTRITTNEISKLSARINLDIEIKNDSQNKTQISILTNIFFIDSCDTKDSVSVATFNPKIANIDAGGKQIISESIILKNPKLWGPPSYQKPNRYVALTKIFNGKEEIDKYETKFGIRSLRFEPDSGIFVNNKLVKIKGVNQHHDLGALGSAFNTSTAERQLQILKEMGCNAIRMSHNPPAPELLELTDKMGFLVIDESFDVWEQKKTDLDFHLIFPEWYEQDLRAMVRRDRNHPSIIIWSIGNEVGEQYTGEKGAKLAEQLKLIVYEEDTIRPVTSAMNWAKPFMPFPAVLDVIGLNYQGEGIRQAPEFEGTDRIRTEPQYDAYHEKYPNKIILSTETASTASSRGIYLFPVTPDISSPIRDGCGGDSNIHQVSSYDLYAVDFGSSPDKVFSAIDHHPFVAGEFVWNGFDYIGEPTPYYEARSSYTGIIDLAGFKKDAFYLYQSRWRPDLPMVHILPHWNWPDRSDKITPVHVFTSGDEAQLFLNGISQGKKKKGKYEYRLRWDDVKYEPGKLKVIAYKNGKKWAEEVVQTTGEPSGLSTSADRNKIKADGKDLSFITLKVIDKKGLVVPTANNIIKFEIDGPGEIIATDNGDPTDFVPFTSHIRNAFNGLGLAIIRSKKDIQGNIIVKATSKNLIDSEIIIKSK